jgi:hypothetical protein
VSLRNVTFVPRAKPGVPEVADRVVVPWLSTDTPSDGMIVLEIAKVAVEAMRSVPVPAKLLLTVTPVQL